MNRTHRGFALLAILVLLSTFSAVMLVRGLRANGESPDFQAERQTLRQLRDARSALLAYSLVEDNTPGTLVCPSEDDILAGTSAGSCMGVSNTSASNPPSRLPWRTLGMQSTTESNGDCLWYAIAAPFRNHLGTENRSSTSTVSPQINPATSVGLRVRTVTSSGSAPTDQTAIAVLFVPGSALESQTGRVHSTAPNCTAGAVGNFLDRYNQNGLDIDNAKGANGDFIRASPGDTHNDRVVAITLQQALKPILRRVLVELSTPAARAMILARGGSSDGIALGSLRTLGPDSATAAANALMFDIAVDAHVKYVPSELEVPLPPPSLPAPYCRAGTFPVEGYKRPVSWLCFNAWYDHVLYFGADPTDRKLTILLNPAAVNDYRCTMNLDSGVTKCGT